MKTRDEKGRFAPAPVEMTEEQRETVCYKSKLLNKYFDKYEDLVTAEDEYKKAHELELKEKEARQSDAKIVEDAAKAYLELVEKNKQERAEMSKAEDALYSAYKQKLVEFSKNHKNYHLSYSYDGKNVEFKVEENRNTSLQEYIDYQNRLMRNIFDNFWF